MGTKEGVSGIKYYLVLVFYVLLLTSIAFMGISQLEYTGHVTKFTTMVGDPCGGGTQCTCGDFLVASRDMDNSDNLIGCDDTALIINASNVVFDCGGEVISGEPNSDFGIYNPGFDNVTITNCFILNFTTGIFFNNQSNNGNLTSNIIFNNTEHGIFINDSMYILIDDFSSRFNGKNGVFIANSFNVTVNDATKGELSDEGIDFNNIGVYVLDSNLTFIFNNIIKFNGNQSPIEYGGYNLTPSGGVRAVNSENVVVAANSFTNNGVVLLNCPASTVMSGVIPVPTPSLLANNFIGDQAFNITFLGIYFTNGSFVGGIPPSAPPNLFNYTVNAVNDAAGFTSSAIELVEAFGNNISDNTINVEDDESVATIIKNSENNLFGNNTYNAPDPNKKVDFFHIFASNNILSRNTMTYRDNFVSTILISSLGGPPGFSDSFTAENNTFISNTIMGTSGFPGVTTLISGGNNFTNNIIKVGGLSEFWEFVDGVDTSNPLKNNNISGAGNDYTIFRFAGGSPFSPLTPAEAILWLDGSVPNATGRVFDFTTLKKFLISVNDTGLPNFNSSAALLFTDVDCTFFDLIYNESYFTDLETLRNNSKVVATEANNGGDCDDSSICNSISCIGPAGAGVLTFAVDEFSSFGIKTPGCVNLSDPTTYRGRVNRTAEITSPTTFNYYINKNTTLCRGKYFLPDEDSDSVIIMNNSNIFLDCNASILFGNRTSLEQGEESNAILNGNNSNTIVRNCNIKNYSNGITFVGDLSGVIIINNNITNLFINSTPTGGVDMDGIRFEAGGPGNIFRNSLIMNNRIEEIICIDGNCEGIFGISLGDGGSYINNTVINNTVKNVVSESGNTAGIGKTTEDGPLADNIISNNFVFNISNSDGIAVGIFEFLIPDQVPPITNDKIINNNVSEIRSPLFAIGIVVAGESNVNVTNNTVCMTDTFGIASIDANVIPEHPALLTENNICKDTNTGKIAVIWLGQVRARKCGKGLAGVLVNVTQINGSSIFVNTTNATGLTERISVFDGTGIIFEYIVNNSDVRINQTPHTITGTLGTQIITQVFNFGRSKLATRPSPFNEIILTFPCPGTKRNGGGTAGRRTVRGSGTTCGDGICDPWENETLCLQDCRKPAPPTKAVIINETPEEKPVKVEIPAPEIPRAEEEIKKKFPWWILLVITLAILLGGMIYNEREWIKERYVAITKPSTKKPKVIPVVAPIKKAKPIVAPVKIPKKVEPKGNKIIDKLIANIKSEGANEEEVRQRLKRLGWKDKTINQHLKP